MVHTPRFCDSRFSCILKMLTFGGIVTGIYRMEAELLCSKSTGHATCCSGR